MPLPSRTEFLDNLWTTTWYEMKDSTVDNIFDATPFWFWLKSKGRMDTQTGGRFLTESLRYAKSDNVKWVQKGSTVSLDDKEFMTVAVYPWRYLADSIVRFGIDEQQNAGKSQIINLMQSKLENSQDSLVSELEAVLFAAQAGLKIYGLQDLVKDDPSTGTIGGIDPVSNTWWRNQFKNMTGLSMAAYLIPEMRTLLNKCMNNLRMDAPDIIVCGQSIYEAYEDGVVEQKQIVNKTLGDAGFIAIEYKGLPLLWSPSCANTRLYMLNTRFLKFKYDPRMFFDMTEWKSIPNQINDRAAQIITAGNLLTSRRRCHGVLFNLDTL